MLGAAGSDFKARWARLWGWGWVMWPRGAGGAVRCLWRAVERARKSPPGEGGLGGGGGCGGGYRPRSCISALTAAHAAISRGGALSSLSRP